MVFCFLPIGSWSEKSLWYKTFGFLPDTKSLEEFCYWLIFCVSAFLWWFRPFENPVTACICHPMYFRFLNLLFVWKRCFPFVQDTLFTRFFPVRKTGFIFLLWNFLVSLDCFSFAFFWFDPATSVSGPFIPVQNDHLKLQIGFCLFCFDQIHPFRPWMRRQTSGVDSLLSF